MNSVPGGAGSAPNCPPGTHDALGPDGLQDLRYGYAQMRQAVRLDPDTHGIVTGADDVDPADTFDAGQYILDVDQRIVAQELLVEFSVLGCQRDQDEDIGKRLSVVTPRRVTSSGSIAVAAATRFCVKTVFMSGSVPISKET